jgi:hypothetical protein
MMAGTQPLQTVLPAQVGRSTTRGTRIFCQPFLPYPIIAPRIRSSDCLVP